ncbi:hypothetical protein AAY473_012229 [Plecturocebus cupreus]
MAPPTELPARPERGGAPGSRAMGRLVAVGLLGIALALLGERLLALRYGVLLYCPGWSLTFELKPSSGLGLPQCWDCRCLTLPPKPEYSVTVKAHCDLKLLGTSSPPFSAS